MDHCAGRTFIGFVFKSGLVGAWACAWSPKSHSGNCLCCWKVNPTLFFGCLLESEDQFSSSYSVWELQCGGVVFLEKEKIQQLECVNLLERKPWIFSAWAQKFPKLCQKRREQDIAQGSVWELLGLSQESESRPGFQGESGETAKFLTLGRTLLDTPTLLGH